MSNYIDLSVREQSLRAAARDLRAQFQQLRTIRWTKPKIRLARKMRPTFGPQSPTPDNDWSLNIEDCMINERRDEHIPGGLAVMVADALEHAGHQPPLEPTGIKLCGLVEQFAWDIAERFPPVDDLTDLMIEQTAYIATAIKRRYPDNERTTMTKPLPASEIVRQLAIRGTATTIDTVRGWARHGHITSTELPNGRHGYQLAECLNHIRQVQAQKDLPTPTSDV